MNIAPLSGSDGAFKRNGTKIATTIEWILNHNTDKIETTPLNTWAKEYTPQHYSTTGSAKILYDPSIAEVKQLFDGILLNPHNIYRFNCVLQEKTGYEIVSDCIIDGMTIPQVAGELMSTTIQFTVQGSLETVN